MKLCWLVPDDRGGGIVSVVQDCCAALTDFGYEITLLFVLSPISKLHASSNFRVASLHLSEPASETPKALLEWLKSNPHDVLFLNGCDQADVAIAYLPKMLCCVYVVHDTASRYWNIAIQQEENLDKIVAVSETIACQFRSRLKEPNKLSTILNGCNFPLLSDRTNPRPNDLVFLGGNKPIKGAFDVLAVWNKLLTLGFHGRLHWFGVLSPTFQAEINRLPESERICSYGQAPRELIFSTAASSKVLLMLSRVEPFGMTTIEAMSMGCVPIAWDIETGTKEIIGTTKTGVFVPLGNIEQLAEKILNVCDQHSTLEDAVISQARTYFEASVMAENYHVLIHNLKTQPPIHRSHSSQEPPSYQPPVRKFQLLPSSIRTAVRELIGRSPQLGYWLRDWRGF